MHIVEYRIYKKNFNKVKNYLDTLADSVSSDDATSYNSNLDEHQFPSGDHVLSVSLSCDDYSPRHFC